MLLKPVVPVSPVRVNDIVVSPEDWLVVIVALVICEAVMFPLMGRLVVVLLMVACMVAGFRVGVGVGFVVGVWVGLGEGVGVGIGEVFCGMGGGVSRIMVVL